MMEASELPWETIHDFNYTRLVILLYVWLVKVAMMMLINLSSNIWYVLPSTIWSVFMNTTLSSKSRNQREPPEPWYNCNLNSGAPFLGNVAWIL